jgi:hypothetical protein
LLLDALWLLLLAATSTTMDIDKVAAIAIAETTVMIFINPPERPNAPNVTTMNARCEAIVKEGSKKSMMIPTPTNGGSRYSAPVSLTVGGAVFAF